MVNFLELPSDLIDKIVKRCASDMSTLPTISTSRSTTTRSTVQNLAPLSMTCKTLHEFTQPLVWKTFEITIKTEAHELLERPIKRIQFVSESVKIRPLIRRISVSIEGEHLISAGLGQQHWDELASSLSPLLVGRCKSLTAFDWSCCRISPEEHPGALPALEEAISRSNLKSLFFFEHCDDHYPSVHSAWMQTTSLGSY